MGRRSGCVGAGALLVGMAGACAEPATDLLPGAGFGPSGSGGQGGVADGGGGLGGAASQGGGPIGGAAAGGEEPVVAFTRYRDDEVRSPVTENVAQRARAIVDGHQPQVFMKVGASGTVSANFLDCLAGTAIDLDGRDVLQSTIDYFDAGDAAGSSPWARDTLAAVVGKSASWAITGDPSPIEQEIAAIDPRYALVNYGTNDMQLGTTYRSALFPFYESFNELLDQLEAQGIVPVVTGLNPRTDSVGAAQWVPTYDAVVRGVAEARQLPYVHLYRAVVDLADQGLVGDGIHGNVAPTGACDFSAAGLAYNYNRRNLLTLEALHDLRRVVEGEPAPDAIVDGYVGTGTASDPIVIDRLPFTHADDTSTGASTIDGYPACDTGQDESGVERFYRLDLAETTSLRFALLDRGGVDVDLHLLDGSPTADACVARSDRILEDTLGPGTYFLVVDTYVASGGPASGPYLFTALACESGDPDC